MRAYDATAKRQVYRSYQHSQPTGGVREAKKRQRRLAEEVRTGKVSADSATFGYLLDRFLEHSISIGRATTTIHGYRIKIGKIESALGRIPLRKLTAGDIDAWYGQLRTDGMSPATIKHHHRLIVAALNQAMKWDMVSRNVATLASPPRAAKFEINPPTQQQVNELIALAKESRIRYLADLLYLVAVLGLRRGETCGLRWTDIRWKKPSLVVQRSVAQTASELSVGPTKSGQTRELPFDSSVKTLLQDHHQNVLADADLASVPLSHDAYIFSPDPDGATPLRPDTLTQSFNRLCRKAETPARKAAKKAKRGLRDDERWPYRFHDLRHFAATNLLANGVDIITVSKRMGHADPSLTLRVYGHLVDEQNTRAANLAAAGLIR